MDAPEDRDVKLQKVSGDLLQDFRDALPRLLYAGDTVRPAVDEKAVEKLVVVIEPFQESPQLLDPHLASFLAPLTSAFLSSLAPVSPTPTPAVTDEKGGSRKNTFSLLEGVSRLLYTLSKIRGPKIICRFFPNEPKWLEPMSSVFSSPQFQPAVERSWELRYILLLWLSHLLLTPFDLSTISAATVTASDSASLTKLLDVPNLPSLSKTVLGLGVKYLSSPGNRESDAAALVLIRLSLRKDMRALGLLDAVVQWGLESWSSSNTAESTSHLSSGSLFLKTGILAFLAGILAQGDRPVVLPFISKILPLVKSIEEQDGEEWKSGSVRRLGIKVYRWIAILSLSAEEAGDFEGGEEIVEDIIERLLGALGDRDTAVRLGASKSLAVVARKLDPEMAGDVLEAVMGIYDENVFYSPSNKKKKILTAVTPEKWHGATLTLATFLRQRAVRSTEVLERVVRCIVEALGFEQRRATFSLGGNVRDAACYASWSLARSYTTDELLAVGDVSIGGAAGKKIPQLLATELVVAGSLDPLGNIRRAASAALQELVGRHPGQMVEGIKLVQVVDYNAVALRRRSVFDVAKAAAVLDLEYWKGIVAGIIEGWRGVGSSDLDGRKISGKGLRGLVGIGFADDRAEERKGRGREIVKGLVGRIRSEGYADVEIWHGGVWGLAEALYGLADDAEGAGFYKDEEGMLIRDDEMEQLLSHVFEKLGGKEFINPTLRPELTSEAACRLVESLTNISNPSIISDPSSQFLIPATIPYHRLWLAIVEASLNRTEDVVLDQAIPAAHALFGVISLEHRQSIIASWCRRISAGKKRGHILALGEIMSYITDPSEKETVLSVILSAASRNGEVELRVAGTRALGRGALSHGILTPEIENTLFAALDDYTSDSRGDVGSWVRAEGITAVLSGWRNGVLATAQPDTKHALQGRIIRLSVEKLDRLRVKACEAVLEITEKEIEFAGLIDRSLPSDVLASSSTSAGGSYFTALMHILEIPIPEIQIAFLEGYVTSAGTGSDSLLKSSWKALVEYLDALPIEKLQSTADVLLTVIERHMGDDRVLVAALEVIGGLLETELLRKLQQDGRKWAWGRLFILVQKSHFRSGNVSKLSAAVRVYRGLAMALIDDDDHHGETGLRKKAVAKMCTMLGHPFPKIRALVADGLYLYLLLADAVCEVGLTKDDLEKAEKALVNEDWMKQPKELKKSICELKDGLGVA